MAEKQKATLKVIVARIIVGVLFSMLIVSFAIWGIGPIFRQGGRLLPLAEVGPVRIMPQEFQEQYNRELRRLQTVLQTELDPQSARERGIPQLVVQNMVGRILFDLAAQDAGIAISDSVVRQAIVNNPNFRNNQGQFDRNLFQNLLYNAGYSEDRFLALTRDELARAQVTEAITVGATVPSQLLDMLYRYRNERRVAEMLAVPASSINDIPSPTEEELKAHHEDHADAFTAPEYRAATAVLIQPQQLVADIKVPEDKLKTEYEARIGEFRIPEQRTLHQILLPDEASATRAKDMLSKGESFEDVAKAVTGKPPLDLGTVKQADIGTDELGASAFELEEGSYSAPIHGPLGWHIIQAVKIIPGYTKTLDEVKNKLSHDIALREASDAVFDIGNKLQDALGGGASLEEAAKKLNLKAVKTDLVDNKGNGADGKLVQNLPKSPKFLSTAFSSEAGRESDLIDDDQGGYFILRVDKIVPSHLRPLAEVRDKVLAEWQAEARRKAAEKIAGTLLEKAKGGASLADLAKSGGYAVSTTKPFTRTGQGAEAELPPALVASLFASKVGDATMAPSQQGAMVAKLTEIRPVDAKANAAALSTLRDQLGGALAGDLLNEFANALRDRYGVEINNDVINNLLGS